MTEEKRRKLEYAHRFAIEHLRDESRAFWMKVAALLTVNSLLVAGFALFWSRTYATIDVSINESVNPNMALLMLIIAGSGIAIQAMWWFFTITSYSHFESLGKIIAEVEDEIEKCDEYKGIEPQVSKLWHYYGQYRKEFYQKLPRRSVILIPISRLRMVLSKNPAAAIAIVLFFVIFLSIWIYALVIIKAVNQDIGLISYLLAIILPSIFVLLSMGITGIMGFGKTGHDRAVKAVKKHLYKEYKIDMEENISVGTSKRIDLTGYDKNGKAWYLCAVITNSNDIEKAPNQLKDNINFIRDRSKKDKVNCFVGVIKELHSVIREDSSWNLFEKEMKKRRTKINVLTISLEYWPKYPFNLRVIYKISGCPQS